MKKLFCIAIILSSFLIAQAQTEINLSKTGTAIIDGKIEEKEWQNASVFDLSDGGKVYFKYDGEFLYVGVRGAKNGWCHLYLNEGDSSDISVIHASAALGKIVYRQDKNKSWQTADKFVWELRDEKNTAETQRKMDDYLSKNGWVSSNNKTGNPSEIEFKLKSQNVVKAPLRVAVVYMFDDVKTQFFPATLADDSLKKELLSGATPPDLKFDLSRWAKINLMRNASSPISGETADEQSAGAVADKLFEAMRLKNYEQIKSLFLENGQLTALDKPKNGQGFSTTRNFSGDAFAKMISEAKAAEFVEKMPSKDVRIYGDSAIVSGRYTFRVGEKFSHCGTNAFHLLKSNGEWKIANATSTIETKNCETPKDFSAENKDALAAVNKLFELMTAHKPAEIIQMHTPESQLTALIKRKDGKAEIENLTREAFSKFFEKKTAEIAEKMYEEKVRVEGDLAIVDGRYIFTVNGKILHCGMNSFHLVRTADGWKLGNSISTIEPNGCTEKEKAMIK